MLGSSFPAIAENLSIAADQAGYIGLVVSGCTILSSFFSEKLISKLTTKWVVSLSILLTAFGLFLFSMVKEGYTWMFYLAAIPLGLGAGAIDSALNNYVALHYKAIHMNWLHCSWGVGASVSPLIISPFIDTSHQSSGWEKGVRVVAIVQLSIALISFLALPLWKKANHSEEKLKKEEEKEIISVEKRPLYRNPVFYLAIIGFFCYCGLETTTGLWSGNYFYYTWNVDSKEAASLTSLFYIGITTGRFICGPLSLKIKEKWMIRIGESVLITGLVLMLLPFSKYCAIVGIVLCGVGCAPIYPAIIRLTPYRFSKAVSLKAMGMQMAIAYLGNVTLSPLFGLTARMLGNQFYLLPYVILFFALLMTVVHEMLNVRLKKRDTTLTDEEKLQYQTM